MTHRLLRHPEDAEDAAQEAILRAYKAIDSGTIPDNIGAWLTTIAKREAYRLHGRRPESSRTLDELPTSDPHDEDPANAIVDRLTAHQLLREMTTDVQELLLRRFALDQTSSEIAAAVHAPASTVRVRLHRTLGQMRQPQ